MHNQNFKLFKKGTRYVRIVDRIAARNTVADLWSLNRTRNDWQQISSWQSRKTAHQDNKMGMEKSMAFTEAPVQKT